LRDEAAQQSLSGGRFAAQMPVLDEATRHLICGKEGMCAVEIESCDVAKVLNSVDVVVLWLSSLMFGCCCYFWGLARL
jgi:hypothetical protein